MPRAKWQHLCRYARWLYRHRVCKVSIHALAREYHQSKLCRHRRSETHDEVADRRAVQLGIAEAERLLGLTGPHRFKEKPEGG